jgi:hypothetical protein
MSETKEYHKFCSTLVSSKYAFRSGKVANFVDGKYLTAIKSEIEELTAEIESDNPYLYVDKNELTVSSDKADPLETYRKKVIEEYIAAQTKAINPANDMGNTVSSGVGLQTSQNIAENAKVVNSAPVKK